MHAESLFLPADLPGSTALTPAATLALVVFAVAVIALGVLIRKPRDRRLSVYVLLALALVGIYATMAFVLERLVDARSGLLRQIVTLGFAAAVAVTYPPLRQRLQQAID